MRSDPRSLYNELVKAVRVFRDNAQSDDEGDRQRAAELLQAAANNAAEWAKNRGKSGSRRYN